MTGGSRLRGYVPLFAAPLVCEDTMEIGSAFKLTHGNVHSYSMANVPELFWAPLPKIAHDHFPRKNIWNNFPPKSWTVFRLGRVGAMY